MVIWPFDVSLALTMMLPYINTVSLLYRKAEKRANRGFWQ
jgi:hypothetical protein